MEVWKGDLIISNDSPIISDIHLSAASAEHIHFPLKAQLRFLAFVDPSRIPLHLIFGPKLDVWTTKEETEAWFSSTLIQDDRDEEGKEAPWWQSARPESLLGVLAAVEAEQYDLTGRPRITELMFLPTKSSSTPLCPPTPPPSSQSNESVAAQPQQTVSLHAFTLSSDLARSGWEAVAPFPSPSASDTECDQIQATFLQDPYSVPQPPSKPVVNGLKRKSINDTFTEADTLRKRIRQKPGESVQAASAAPRSMPSLKDLTASSMQARPQTSSSRPQSAMSNVPIQTRPLSRSPSISSIAAGVGGARTASLSRRDGSGGGEGLKRSSLARVQSVATSAPDTALANPDIEVKNRESISRLVMAGMRLHGLSQSKSKSKRRASLAPSSFARSESLSTSFGLQDQHSTEDPSAPAKKDSETTVIFGEEEDRRKDEDYKLIYHTAFKGTCFALRHHINKTPLHLHTDALRDVVDRLLALYCGDPLSTALSAAAAAAAAAAAGGTANERVTPGGKKIFETPGEDAGEESPFLPIGGGVRGENKRGEKREVGVEITPTTRRRGKEREGGEVG